MKLWVITKKCEKKKGNTNIKQIVFPFGRAETEGFGPSCRDGVMNAFRAGRVTAASLRLQDVCLFKKADYILLYIFFEICIEKSQNNFHQFALASVFMHMKTRR